MDDVSKQNSSIDVMIDVPMKERVKVLPSHSRKVSFPQPKLEYKIYTVLKALQLLLQLYHNTFIKHRIASIAYNNVKLALQTAMFISYLATVVQLRCKNAIIYHSIYGLFYAQLIICAILITVAKAKNFLNSTFNKVPFIVYSEFVKLSVLIFSILFYIKCSEVCREFSFKNLTATVLIAILYIIVEMAFLVLSFLLVVMLVLGLAIESISIAIRKRHMTEKSFMIHFFLYHNALGKINCIICLEDFQEGQNISFLKCQCDGFYHTLCIVSWYLAHMQCPLCRTKTIIA
jgi:hypothetical protein